MTEKTAFDPLTAGTAAAMLPALLLRVLGTGGYAGKLSRGAGWRRPVVAATDLAVNRAAEGVGDLAMATASLNWTIRKTMEAARAGRTVETPSLEEQEADLLTPFATGFDEEMGKHAGLRDRIQRVAAGALTRVLPEAPAGNVREMGEHFMKTEPTVPSLMSVVNKVKSSPALKAEANDYWGRFRKDKALQGRNKEMTAIAPLHLEDPSKMAPGEIANLVGKAKEPGMVGHARNLFRDMFPKEGQVAFRDELGKLAFSGRLSGALDVLATKTHAAADGLARRTAPRALRSAMTESPHMLDALSAAMLRMGDVRAAVEFDRVGRAGSRIVRKGLLAQVPGMPKGSLLPTASLHRLASAVSSAPESIPLALLPGGSLTTPTYLAAKKRLVHRIAGTDKAYPQGGRR